MKRQNNGNDALRTTTLRSSWRLLPVLPSGPGPGYSLSLVRGRDGSGSRGRRGGGGGGGASAGIKQRREVESRALST